ncbi:MAG: PKD domain-containing protein [Bacteroidota bacterium]
MKKLLFVAILVLLFQASYGQVPVANFSANVTSGCGSLIVTFQNLSTNSPTSYLWTFGDGGTSNATNPTHNYLAPGTYNVTLKATNGSGNNTMVKNAYIKVYAFPNVSFTGAPLNGCTPSNVCFTNTSTAGGGPITSYSWSFGDGGSATTASPCHIYNSPGTFQVILTVNDQNSCSKSLAKPNYINILPSPSAGFTYTSSVPCNPPVTYTFTNTSVPTTSTYSWNFGDAGTSSQQNPVHNYSTAGTYTARLIVSNNGCSDTVSQTINVSSGLFNANFNASAVSGCAPLAVNFTDISGPGDNSWSWNFGDLGTSTSHNPSHTYSTPGTYTVTLISSGSGGCIDTIVKTNYITVYGLPTVTFTGSPLFSCNTPLNTNFSCTVPGATAWSWTFGDGGTATTQNPMHPYSTTGIFSVTLTLTDNHGCSSSFTRPNYVKISPPVVQYIATPREGCFPLPVSFTDNTTTTSYLTSHLWNFGDGTPTSNLTNPNHVYADTGVYLVSLTVVDSAGCSKTRVDTVKVGQKPIANFAADDTVGCHKFKVNFTDLSSYWANQWEWDFGGNGTSTLQNPLHTFTDTGYFDVRLIVKHNGCADTMNKNNYIKVLPPKPEFTASPLIGCSVPFNVQFTDQSADAQTWLWQFGDGTTSSSQNPLHTYTTAKYDTVKLIVSNSNGCSDTIIKPDFIRISNTLPNFIQGNNSICQYGTIAFMSTTTTNNTVTSYNWNFGDGGTGTGFGINHTFNTPGVYSITLRTTDILGCIDSIRKNNLIAINALPSPQFIVNNTFGCAPLHVQFTNQSTPVSPATIATYAWDFGDGQVSNLQSPAHTYAAPGTYTVTLHIIDSKGCDSTKIKASLITVASPIAKFTCDTVKCNLQPIQFTNLSTGGTSNTWDFGDGSPTVSTTNAVHAFNVTQTTVFNVTLTVLDGNGCDSVMVQQIRIARPTANFGANMVTANCPPLGINFIDSSTTDVSQWWWSFGEASGSSDNYSSISDPQHIYNNPGVYDIQLIATAYGCSDTINKPGFISVFGPAGTMSFTPLSGCSPLNVNFTANATSTTSYFWVFGDDNATTTYNNTTSHTYQAGGTFNPILILNDSIHHCTLPITSPDVLNVIAGIAGFGYTNAGTCADSATIYFTDTSYATNPITAWHWDFGDGATSNLQNPSHFYNTNGTFSVTLTITVGPCSYSVTYDSIVTIFIVPDLIYNFTTTSTCTPPLVTQMVVNNASITDSITTWHWDFGDGTTSNVKNPPHTYFNNGVYNVVLSVTFANGCAHVYSSNINIQIYNYPIASFTTDTNNVMASEPITFIDGSTGTTLHWTWDFGDGGTSTLQNPVYAYTEAGTFAATLIVATPNGCADTAFKNMNILSDIKVPNVFTPNGDGHNDKFEIVSRGFSEYYLLVYDRWGKIVYKTTSPTEFWDGTVNGKPVADGTYYWTLDLKNQVKSKSINGTVTVIR